MLLHKNSLHPTADSVFASGRSLGPVRQTRRPNIGESAHDTHQLALVQGQKNYRLCVWNDLQPKKLRTRMARHCGQQRRIRARGGSRSWKCWARRWRSWHYTRRGGGGRRLRPAQFDKQQRRCMGLGLGRNTPREDFREQVAGTIPLSYLIRWCFRNRMFYADVLGTASALATLLFRNHQRMRYDSGKCTCNTPVPENFRVCTSS